ncbi:MAG: co-chaperone GroES [Planctomycetes bacterium]|nr:co-chaperone GroES [Planctomycetota bacterium]
MNVTPLDDRVLVLPIEASTTTAGGIVLPDSAKEKSQRGEVISVGSGKLLDNGKRAELAVKKGDRVLFGKYAGTEIKIDGKEHQIMRESEILAVLEEK